MQKHPNPNYRASAQWVFDTFGLVVNVEELFSTLDSTLGDSRRGTEERGNIANFQKPTLTRGVAGVVYSDSQLRSWRVSKFF
jgi:hypothetical protein